MRASRHKDLLRVSLSQEEKLLTCKANLALPFPFLFSLKYPFVCMKHGKAMVDAKIIESFSTNDESDYEYEIWKQVLRSIRKVSNLVR